MDDLAALPDDIDTLKAALAMERARVHEVVAAPASRAWIVGHLRDLYGIEVSPDLISAVTDAELEEVAAWQARPLEAGTVRNFVRRLGMIGAKEPAHAATQRTSYS
jgi:hypothetical protein